MENIPKKLSSQTKAFFLLLTVAAGVFIMWPLHDFQYYLAQGDHGRDLYCFKKTMEGALPYRDYSWLFGPLMPYYYSIFYLLGGVTIQSVLLGQGLLVLLAGILVYLTCAVFLSPAMSFVCALWYWAFRGAEFFYTYNHIGGLAALLAAVYFLFRYIRGNRLFPVCAGFISVFLLALIRLNMGLAVLAAFVLSLVLADFAHKDPAALRKRRLYVCLSLAVLAGTFLIYWLLLHPLPEYAVSQSFPYGKSQRTDYLPSVSASIFYAWHMIVSYFNATWAQRAFGALLALAGLQSAILIFSRKTPAEFKRNMILVFASLFIFLLAGSHEFIASGVFYRLYWIFPVLFIIIFCLIAAAAKNISSRAVKTLILVTLFLPPFWTIQNEHRKIRLFKRPEHMLLVGKNKIYTMQHPAWFRTVGAAVDFIKANVPPEEKILVLPMDPLYLFLGERDSAARQLVFFEHINVPEEQERKIITDLEKEKTAWVLISSRADSPEPGLGTFGKTYCPLLAKYIADNFAVAAEFGDWVNPPGWAWNHGVRILKRK